MAQGSHVLVKLIMSADNSDTDPDHAPHRCAPAHNLLRSDLIARGHTNLHPVDNNPYRSNFTVNVPLTTVGTVLTDRTECSSACHQDG
jgi:hypothetical protein